MNRFSKTMLASAVALTIIAAPATGFAESGSQQPVNVTIDGALQKFQQPALNVNGSILVPFRAIFEAFGAKVHWDAANKRVTAYKDNQLITLDIGSTTAYVNDKYVSLPQAPRVVAGSTLVPLRFVSEALGANVSWNGDAQTAQIVKPDPNKAKPVYGFTLPVPESWKGAVKSMDSNNDSSVLSAYPLTGNDEYRFILDTIDDVEIGIPLFTITTFRQSEEEWKAGPYSTGYHYIATKNGITFTYSTNVDTVEEVQSIGGDPMSGGLQLTDAQAARVGDILAKLPETLAGMTTVDTKPAASTLLSYRSLEGTWTSASGLTAKLSFITDRAAILTIPDIADTVVKFYDNGSFSYSIYREHMIYSENGKMVEQVPIVIDGMYQGENETYVMKQTK